jgi:hypothetical protein
MTLAISVQVAAYQTYALSNAIWPRTTHLTTHDGKVPVGNPNPVGSLCAMGSEPFSGRLGSQIRPGEG